MICTNARRSGAPVSARSTRPDRLDEPVAMDIGPGGMGMTETVCADTGDVNNAAATNKAVFKIVLRSPFCVLRSRVRRSAFGVQSAEGQALWERRTENDKNQPSAFH